MSEQRINAFARVALLRGLGAFMLLNVLLIYVPTSALSLVVIAILSCLSCLLDHRKLLPLASSLVITTLLLEGVVRSGGISVSPYFRPHEVLALEKSYRPNRSVEMQVPHGDLLTINPALAKELAVPRHEILKTDSFGNPNAADFNGEQLILVGDSFLVGTETTLAQRLLSRHGIQTHTVAFSGSGPLVYAEKVAWARERLSSDSCIALFYFEGNDFRVTNAADVATREAVPQGAQQLVRAYLRETRGRSEWSKVFNGLLQRSLEVARLRGMPWSAPRATPTVETTLVRSVGGKPMAFLRGYAEVVERQAFDDNGFVSARLAEARPDLVVFIPDKYRVYSPLFDESPVTGLPHAQWSYLKAAADSLSIDAIDLTATLVEQSRKLLDADRTTFWRDDTHWNQFGEDAAADRVVDALGASLIASCKSVPKAK